MRNQLTGSWGLRAAQFSLVFAVLLLTLAVPAW